MNARHPFRWIATAVHLDGTSVEAEVVHAEMPSLQEFAAALLVKVEVLAMRPRRGGARHRSHLRRLKDHGFSIDGIRTMSIDPDDMALRPEQA